MLAFSQQRRDRYVQMLPQQVEQCGLDGGYRVDGGAQVEGLLAAATGVAVGEPDLHVLQHLSMRANRLAHHQLAGFVQRLPDLLAAGHFADTGVSGAVGQDQQVAGKKRAMGAAEV